MPKTSDDDLTDSQWLAALAGDPDPKADPQSNWQPLALRKALQARSERLTLEVPKADQALYEQTLFRLRREGMLRKRPLWRVPAAWGVAATFVLGVAVVIQMDGRFKGDGELDTLRGGGQSTVLIVTDPEARLAELLTGLKAVGADPKTERLSGGRIVLRVKSTSTTLDYLSTQRIEPNVKDGQVVLMLTPSTRKP